jgi:hypothetical protein
MRTTQNYARLGLALLIATGLAACVQVETGRPPKEPVNGTEAVTLPVLMDGSAKAWSVANTAEAEGVRTLQFVPNGQTMKNWTELVTLQTVDKQSPLRRTSLDDFLAAENERVAKQCPGSSVDLLLKRTDGLLFASQLASCDEPPPAEIGRVIEGSENRFVLRYLVRGKLSMTPERRQAWFGRLERVQLLRLPQR